MDREKSRFMKNPGARKSRSATKEYKNQGAQERKCINTKF
jgi:hypothetical protein